jgi:ADP-ribose pyrophosphatase YjhB (NUDIX family)
MGFYAGVIARPMTMRKAVRAVIIKDKQLLVMHRNKFGTEYETLPGGNIEVGETHEQAVSREVDEESSIAIANPRLVFVEEAGDPYGTQYIYLCDYVSGEAQLRPYSEEAHINKLGQNLYEPRWVDIDKLPQLPFLSEKLKAAILQALATGFPSEPQLIR